MVSDSLPALLTEREAAQFLRVHPSTLAGGRKPVIRLSSPCS